MLGIILQILKIIGIILLLLLGFVLAVTIAVLFVPVRYRLKTSAHPSSVSAPADSLQDAFLQSDIKIEADSYWLLHFLHFSFRMCKNFGKGEEEETGDGAKRKEPMRCLLRIFGIPVVDFLNPKPKKEKKKQKKRKREDKKQKDKKNKVKKKETASVSLSDLEREAKEQECREPEGEKEATGGRKADPGTDETAQSTEKESKLKQFVELLKKLFEKIRHIKYTVIGFLDKLKKMAESAKYYKDTLTGEETKAARDKVFAMFRQMGRHIRPSVFRTELVIGTPEPEVMGEILSVFGILIPLLGDTVTVTPYFDRYVAELELQMKGRMAVRVFLRLLWKLKFDADINQAWDLLKNPTL